MIDNKNEGSLPPYELLITNGEYPFKNAHISKVFSIQVVQQIDKNSKNLHQILQAYHSIQSSLLINIVSIQSKNQSKARVSYEYIDTPLAHYIRRFMHQNIQIKLEKLYIELRQLANKFVMKNINVMKAINPKNIGVKMSQIYRESISPQMSNRKNEILMPQFKIFIDLSKCEVIQRMGSIARMVIDTDKMIYTQISKTVNELYKKIEAEEAANRKNMIKMYELPKENKNNALNVALSFSKKEKPAQNVEQVQLDFTNKLKRRKKVNVVQPKQKKQVEPTQDDLNDDTKSERVQSKKVVASQSLYPKQLSAQVNSIIERSRKTLKTFKEIVKTER